MTLACTWLTGPDAGGTHPLPPGRSVVGRAPGADIRAADPALEPHHFLLDATAEGTVTVTPLTGRVRVGDRPVEGPTTLMPGDRIDAGHSRMALVRHEPPAPGAPVLHGGLVRTGRAPIPAPAPFPEPVPPPPPHPAAPGGLLPTALGLAGAAVVAAVVRQPMFLLFGALGSTVAFGSWAAQFVAHRRTVRQADRAHGEALAAAAAQVAAGRAAFVAARSAATPGVAAAMRDAATLSTAVWARRSTDADAFLAALGNGSVWWGDERCDDVPVAADLGPGSRVAVVGPQARAVARALLAQLAVATGPADLRVVVVTAQPERWGWLQSLPQAVLPDGTTTVVDDLLLPDVLAALRPGPEGAHVLLVTDQPAVLTARTSHLRRALAEPGVGLLAVLDDGPPPHWCTAVLTTSHGRSAGWVADTATTLLPTRLDLAGLGEARAAAVAIALAAVRDPEDPLAGAAAVPRTVCLADLLGPAARGPAAIAAGWVAAGADPAPRTVLGVAADGEVDIDLVRDGPHGLVAGTTGAGKSELLRSLVAGLAVAVPPTHLAFVLVDYKGGATFDACAALPHVVGVVTDLDEALADRVLRSLHAELRRRERLLRDHAVADLTDLRRAAPQVVLPRLVVVIDEFAALVAEQPSFLHALVGVAQRGRSLGVHLLLATQRPQGVISDDIRANTNLRIALRLQDSADALDVVGDPSPAALSRNLPGRAVLRLGPGEHVTFQAAHCTTPAAGGSVLEHLVRQVQDAARLAGMAPPTAPWCAPLPTHLDPTELPAGAVALADDPDRQAQRPVHWTPGDGSVLVAGSGGSGVRAALRLLADAAIRSGAEVARLRPGSDTEGMLRLLHRLRRPLPTPTVLVVEELDLARRLLDRPDTLTLLDALDALVDGSGHDRRGAPLTLIAGVRRPAALPAALVHGFAQRWVLHLDDPHEAGVLGVPAAAVPGPIPGRAHLAGTGLTAQLAHAPAAGSTAGSPIAVPAPSSPSLPPAVRDDDLLQLPLGVEVESGEVAVVPLADGDHLLVAGPGRSGRSTTLATLVAAWRGAHPAGLVVAVTPRRSPVEQEADVVHRARTTVDAVRSVASVAPGGACLLVVDDAELVDDPGGELAALAASAQPGFLVLAAGRSDALRALYGHWTGVVRRGRLGVIHTGGSELDGDLFTVALPRRTVLRPRPGLVWALAGGGPVLVQVTPISGAVTAREAG